MVFTLRNQPLVPSGTSGITFDDERRLPVSDLLRWWRPHPRQAGSDLDTLAELLVRLVTEAFGSRRAAACVLRHLD